MNGELVVVRKAGAVVKVRRAIRLDRTTVGQIPTGWDALMETIDRFVTVGTSKFVVLPIVEPASPAAWVQHLHEAAPVVLARQA